MGVVFVAWAGSAAVLVFVAMLLGRAIRSTVLGALIDDRGRYSLTHLQLVLWTVVILSLIAGVAVGRVVGGLGKDSLGFGIPNELLLVLGISAGSAAASTVVKAQKDTSSPARVSASAASDPPRFMQVFLVEEGAMSDKVVDVSKFQNFWITVILIVAYIATAISTISGLAKIADLTVLPGFSATFVTLLGISHAAYIGGKLPNRAGEPVGLSVDDVQANPDNPQLPDGVDPRNRAGRDARSAAPTADPASTS